MDKHPRPWRVEEDWTCEITDANNVIVMKIPYPQELGLAHFIVNAVNSYDPQKDCDHDEAERVIHEDGSVSCGLCGAK